MSDTAHYALRLANGEALDTVLNEVWNVGYVAGRSNAMRRMSDEPDAPTTPSPFAGETGAE